MPETLTQEKEDQEIDFTKIDLDNIEQEEVEATSEEETVEKSNELSETTETKDETEETVEEEVVDEPTEEGEEVSLIDDFKNQLGYEIEGDYEDTEEGLFDFVRDAIEVASKDKFESTIEQFPEVKQFHQFLLNGGNPNEYLSTQFAETDYSKITIDSEDTDLQERVVRLYLKEEGVDDAKATEIVNKYKSGGMLEDQAGLAKNVLSARQEKAKTIQLQEQKKLAEQQQKEAEQYWDSIKETISGSSDFSGITIKESEKDDFFDYINKPVKDGATKRDLDARELTKDQLLAIDLLLYKGFDLEGLIDRKASTKKARSIRERLNKGSNKSLKGSNSERQNVTEFDEETFKHVL